jgi:hypothetical protein
MAEGYPLVFFLVKAISFSLMVQRPGSLFLKFVAQAIGSLVGFGLAYGWDITGLKFGLPLGSPNYDGPHIAGFEFFGSFIFFCVGASIKLMHYNMYSRGVDSAGKPLVTKVNKQLPLSNEHVLASVGGAAVYGCIMFIMTAIGSLISGGIYDPWSWIWLAVFVGDWTLWYAYLASTIAGSILAGLVILFGFAIKKYGDDIRTTHAASAAKTTKDDNCGCTDVF